MEDNSRFVRDPNRRVHAVHLADGEGILVCPTNCGELLGIDLLSKSLAWAYPYREGKKSQGPAGPINPFGPPQFNPVPLTPATWKVAPPAIEAGKVVFTAPDAKSLHCISLRDGTRLWSKKKEESDLFMAGVWDGKVLVVSRNSCYARDLHKNGNIVWKVTTGALPSGQGVASKNIYYLPLENGDICAINIKTGSITRNRPSGTVTAPGNLIFHEGIVVSKTLDEVIVYPRGDGETGSCRSRVQQGTRRSLEDVQPG